MVMCGNLRPYFAAAFLAAQRFFNAATIAARPAALSFRFAFLAAFGAAVFSFDAAHLFRCASAMALRPAALILRLFRPFGVALGLAPSEFAESIPRNSAIWESSFRRCSSK